MNVRADLLLLICLLFPTSACQLTANRQSGASKDAGNPRELKVQHPNDSPRCTSDDDCPKGLVCVCASDQCSVRHWAAGEGEKFEHFCTTPVNEAESKVNNDAP
jgi:hypothetical protein